MTVYAAAADTEEMKRLQWEHSARANEVTEHRVADAAAAAALSAAHADAAAARRVLAGARAAEADFVAAAQHAQHGRHGDGERPRCERCGQELQNDAAAATMAHLKAAVIEAEGACQRAQHAVDSAEAGSAAAEQRREELLAAAQVRGTCRVLCAAAAPLGSKPAL